MDIKNEQVDVSEKKKKKEPIKQNRAGKENAGIFCAYLGPSLPGIIQSGTLYSGTKEQVVKSLSAAVERNPLIAELIVTGETFVEDRIKVKTPGNRLYVYYNKLVAGEKTL